MLKMAVGPKHKIWGAETTSFFAGRPERGNHGLCPTSYGAEVDVHRARAAEGALPAAKSDAFHFLLQRDPWIWNILSVTRSETFGKATGG